jgi:hypothetical protein
MRLKWLDSCVLEDGAIFPHRIDLVDNLTGVVLAKFVNSYYFILN